MKAYRVEFGRRALIELEAVITEIGEGAGLSVAQKWSTTFRTQVASLRHAPYRGVLIAAWGGRRRLVVSPYLIVYDVKEPALVMVQHVVNGRRDLDALFADDLEGLRRDAPSV